MKIMKKMDTEVNTSGTWGGAVHIVWIMKLIKEKDIWIKLVCERHVDMDLCTCWNENGGTPQERSRNQVAVALTEPVMTFLQHPRVLYSIRGCPIPCSLSNFRLHSQPLWDLPFRSWSWSLHNSSYLCFCFFFLFLIPHPNFLKLLIEVVKVT